ncbi:hypothetical protein IAR55_005568 [Kwoniella newhampshirensis]|uniref:Zn(2)-C6 fungal-type domain-containing protein n=1 Tax=Kwoniella newhampshirensis TaxID=1651941 RepID=A0AAW0YWK6_9TREE
MHPSTATTSVKRPLSRNSACEECKLRKIKCPAQKPKCMNCVQHDRLCTYPEPSARRLYLERRYENGQGRSERSVSNETSYQNGGIYPSHGSQISRPAPYPARNPGLHSFQPSAGTGADQPLPAHLDELDFSWLLDIPTLDAPTPEFDQEQYLWLYFTYQTFSGLEMSITRFYERLASPDDAERPHPALLNAIYMTVTRASLIPSVRAKTEMYYDAAQSAFRGAIKDYGTMRSNMLDLMRAAVLMCEWLWTEFREGEALMMTAEACRIATGCCFDQIPSSKSIEPPGRVRLLLRRRPFVNLPRDYVELADRIYAFWSVAMLDMSASIATCMPLHIDILDVVTPLPNPWGTYGEGSSVPDCHVADLFKSPHEQVPPQTHL